MGLQRIDRIREMLAHEPADEFLNYALALELEKEMKMEEAIEILQKILLSNEHYLGAYYKLGHLLEQVHRKKDAEIVYRKGIEIAKAQKNFKTLGELNEALECLDD